MYVPDEVLMIRTGEKLMFSLWAEQGFEAEVDEILALAASLGAETRGPEHRDWGGYTGYFVDPDGFNWEIAVNPGEIGQLVLP